MILVLDNYDSFVHNVARSLRELGADVAVVRNDSRGSAELLHGMDGIVLSPGPCGPRDAGVSIPLVRAAAGRVPLLGICLGHQVVAAAFGGRIMRAPRPLHGRATPVLHRGDGLFRGLPPAFPAGRYHSLVVDPAAVPSALAVTAVSAEGDILGLAHREHPIWGVQFHPESILTPDGDRLLSNFLERCRTPFAAARPVAAGAAGPAGVEGPGGAA